MLENIGGPARTRTWNQGIMRITKSLSGAQKAEEREGIFRVALRLETATEPPAEPYTERVNGERAGRSIFSSDSVG